MSWNSRVAWSEGMFLRPQHFQQHDRYLESLVRFRAGSLRPYDWGVNRLEIDTELLKSGKFAVTACHGLMPDGTPFNIPEDSDPPVPLDLDDNTRNSIIYMVLPVRQAGGLEVDIAGGTEVTARLVANQLEVRDSRVGSESVAEVEVGKLRFRLLPQTSDFGGYIRLGLARVVEVQADKNVVLDRGYMPTGLDCRAVPPLDSFITELLGLLHHRGEAIAARVSASASGRSGAAEIGDFMLLQVVNRYQPLIDHMAKMNDLHPEAVYQTGLQMMGEFATFTQETKRPISLPPYRHDELNETFEPLIEELRRSLSMVLEQNAVLIALEERKYGIRVGTVSDRQLLVAANFVLAVKADLPPEAIRSGLPSQIKIGPVERIRELVNLSLPGIGLQALPVAPRQIPYHAGTTYFELTRGGDLWKQLGKSGGIAVHISGEFPGVELALWAIKE